MSTSLAELVPLEDTTLPVADRRQVRAYLRDVFGRHRKAFIVMLSLQCVSAAFGLVAPRLLGQIVDDVPAGTPGSHVDKLAAVIAVALVVQAVLTRAARYRGFVLGEQVLAELREDFVSDALALPIGVVESAGSGDLLTRTSRDIEQLGWSMRWAVPEWIV